MLCHTFGAKKLERFSIRDYNINDGDTIIFCLGEIDCRCHIFKHIRSGNTYTQIIDNIVKSYFETIKLNVSICPAKLKAVCVFNVVPPVQKNEQPVKISAANGWGMSLTQGTPRIQIYETPDFPFLGSNSERRMYVLYFNKCLKEKCAEYNFIFFDVYEQYIDYRGYLRKELSDDNVHISDGRYITNFISEHLV